MINTVHKYIDRYPVKVSDTALILGTIHPHRAENFLVDFFYGNKNSLWNILSLAFPNLNFSSFEMIQFTLSKADVWISDMIRSCDRESEGVTEDKLLKNIELNTAQIENGIKNSKINTIFFTSGMGKNNAARLFCQAFSIKPILNHNREIEIDEMIFGRKIKGVVLFSPSGQSNVGIKKNKIFMENEYKYKDFRTPVNQFKIDTYREAFKNHFGELSSF
ncbi:hypothetical protein [Aquiflexum lacus]|uniref:hypothetical protein n=1 Tax=Aquiflexum lacus TaxID=2483805 RepID=UPI001892E96D|nr:hypothetical protein [Aquiflexum lacus]